eukprot:jgi/Undpi1/11731/HiC_scaffold_37.g14026.m1
MSPLFRQLLAFLLVAAALRANVCPRDLEPQDQARLERVIRLLASAEFEGRAPGSSGGRATVRWLVARCQGAGLARLGGSYVQEFSIPNPTPAEWREGTALEVPGAAGSRRLLDLGREACPFKLSADGDVEAEVVFAGYGIAAPSLGHDDYRGVDVRGRIVLVLRGAPPLLRNEAGDDVREYMLFRTKVAAAEKAGAVGVLLCNVVAAQRDDPKVALRASGGAGIPAAWLTREVADALFFVAGGDLAARQAVIDKGGDAAAKALGATGARVRMVVDLVDRPRMLETENVIAVLPGTDPKLRHEYIVIGAHHDHLGFGGYGSLAAPAERAQLHPGADDNASGVSVLLELARLLAQVEERPRSVVFAFFGAEEYGLRGSEHFAASGALEPKDIVAMINVDMVGRARSRKLRVEGVSCARGFEDRIRDIAAAQDLPIEMRGRATPRSDHRSFLRRRIPAVHFTTGIHEQYHRPTDVPSLVEGEGLVRTTSLLKALALDLARGPRLTFVNK